MWKKQTGMGKGVGVRMEALEISITHGSFTLLQRGMIREFSVKCNSNICQYVRDVLMSQQRVEGPLRGYPHRHRCPDRSVPQHWQGGALNTQQRGSEGSPPARHIV